MTPQDIAEALKEIGPNVEYSTREADGHVIHVWAVSEVPSPFSHSGKIAFLSMLDEIIPIDATVIEEGSKRYESSARQ